MLHTVNKSPSSAPLLQTCLGMLATGDTVVLLNDGVYGAVRGSQCAPQIERLAAHCSFWALAEDVERRGIKERLLACIQIADYPQFVRLSAQHSSCQSWY
ncbi:sulfurtransferase complex subunit TusB [Gilvimarinus sp. F26214L]|uniref:sulfurtransferase complex subunit TusB n=1 Tax=Gilvimarinus sp. DZF01 TaxID=3461371 RepID=UPI0040463400